MNQLAKPGPNRPGFFCARSDEAGLSGHRQAGTTLLAPQTQNRTGRWGEEVSVHRVGAIRG